MFMCGFVFIIMAVQVDMRNVMEQRSKRFMISPLMSEIDWRDRFFPVSRRIIQQNTLRHGHHNVNQVDRLDKLLLGGEIIAREHAKLVQDINGLMERNPGWSRLRLEEMLLENRISISPRKFGWSMLRLEDMLLENREDGRDDIYTEDVETRHPDLTSVIPIFSSTTTTPRPAAVNVKVVPAVPPSSLKPIAIPVVVLGSPAKLSQKILATKPPYPFVGSASTTRPIRLPTMLTYAGYMQHMRQPKPTLWQRFLSIFPRLV